MAITCGQSALRGARADYYGLSTDTKPTDKVANGSAYIEMDTATLYFFDAAGGRWLPWTREG